MRHRLPSSNCTQRPSNLTSYVKYSYIVNEYKGYRSILSCNRWMALST